MAERYRLETAIGRGGMGEVWRASDDVLGRQVAVKLLLGGDSVEQAAARFRLEAQTAARLHHPHVVTVFDFGSWDNRFYLVMELVEGVSLAQSLAAEGRFSPQRVADVAAQAAAGLAAAHRQGVVHRDIKPGNLMQDGHGTVKIGDFGIARFVDDASAALTSAGQIVGTSLYLAPERALGRPAGPESDVYALGCVLYHLLVGEPPFQADTAAGVLHLHVDVPPSPPSVRCPQLPGAFEEYLLQMLAKKPEDRPSAQAVADWFGSAAWGAGTPPMPGPRAPAAVATYALPPTSVWPAATAPTPAPSRGRRRTAARADASIHVRIRTQMRRHKMLTIVVAGITAFVAAVLISSAWSSGGSGSQQPDAGPSQPADTPSASPSTTPSAAPAAAPPQNHGKDGKDGKKQDEGGGN
ncbi:serine/threonine protein kinase [Actinacidiphila rubida]|uniref:non-specific serine/threonine protein kinase n=1 Tax=Actinacidiphila rubida TaxID=310780 RepID=A0A1H8UJ06_9ACTN|nr:serine/threonine protein kinase [Actinacidiphila rubida]